MVTTRAQNKNPAVKAGNSFTKATKNITHSAAPSSLPDNVHHTTEAPRNSNEYLQELKEIELIEDDIQNQVNVSSKMLLDKLKGLPKHTLGHTIYKERFLGHLGQRVQNPCTFIDTTRTKCHKSSTHHYSAIKHRDLLRPTAPLDIEFWHSMSNPPNLMSFDPDTFHPGDYRTIFTTEHDISGEAGMVWEIVALLKDIIDAMNLKDKIEVMLSRQVQGIEIDVMLTDAKNRPIMAIEVKKPGYRPWDKNIRFLDDHSSYEFHGEDEKTIFSCENDTLRVQKHAGKVLGQHMDQLNALEACGIEKGRGMIISGNTLMLTQNTPSGFEQAMNPSQQVPPPDNSPTKPEFTTAEDTRERERYITTSQMVSYKRTPGLYIAMLREWIHQAYQSRDKLMDTKNISFQRERACRVLSVFDRARKGRNNNVSAKSPDLGVTFVKLNFGNRFLRKDNPKNWNLSNAVIFDPVKPLDLYLFHFLGSGGFGECCLAMANKNPDQFCVVKFLLSSNEHIKNANATVRSSLLKKEEKMWKHIHSDIKDHVYSGEVCQMSYLCMPYVEAISKEKREELISGDQTELLEAFNSIIGKGHVHEDADKWEHIGYFKGKLRFIDLGPNAVREIADGENAFVWRDECLEILAATWKGKEDQLL